MDSDLFFILGLALAVLMIPAIVSALIDARAPRTPAMLAIIGGLMIGYAVYEKPNTYGFDTIGDTLQRVVSRYTN